MLIYNLIVKLEPSQPTTCTEATPDLDESITENVENEGT